MNLRSLLWGLAFLLAGILVAVTADGRPPRIGIGVLLATFGLVLVLMANAAWFLRKTTRPEDYKGTCPVGESCGACGAFNYKPRQECRSCGGSVNAKQAS